MAAKKKAKKKTAKKSKSKALVSMEDYENQMMADASSDSARITSREGGSFISTQNGTFTYQDSDLGDSMEVVIIAFASTNMHYPFVYDKDDPQSPGCAAIGLDDNDYLVPSDESPDKINDDCETCEFNEWGSADVGKGKKCKNGKRLALIHSDSILDEEVEVAMLSIAPTSMGNFNKYVKGLEKTLKRPTYGVVTEVFFDPDDDKVIKFKSVEPVSNPAQMQVIMDQRTLVEDALLEEPDFSNFHEPIKQKKRGGKASKKKTSKKKSSKKSSRFTK